MSPASTLAAGWRTTRCSASARSTGRFDFRAETPALNRLVLAELQTRASRNSGGSRRSDEFDEVMGLAVLAWIVKRFAGTRARCEDASPRTMAYAHRKRRLGYGNRPIGTATGSLAHRVAESRPHVTMGEEVMK
jgi:hypothetical protein